MRVMIVSPDRDKPTIRTIQSHLQPDGGFETCEVVTPDRAEAKCQKDAPDLVIVPMAGEYPELAFGTVRKLRELGVSQLLIVGPATDAKLILRAMQAGADLFLDEQDLRAELGAALASLRARRAPAHRPSQLIAVLSAAGGCGASTVAVNLATLLAKQHGTCNLIDLNLGKADLAPLLDLKPQYSLADLCRNDGRLDRSLYEKLLAQHKSGVGLLSAPRNFEDAYSVTPQGVRLAIATARDAFTDVVVDLENCFHDEQYATLEQATRILLVCRLDFTAIRNTRRILDYLASRGVPPDRVEVVVNHHDLPDQLPVAEAEAAIGGTLKTFIPHDAATAGAASNLGTPMAWTNPTAPVVQSIARIVGLDTPAPPGPSPFARVSNWLRDTVAQRARALIQRLSRPSHGPASDAHPEAEEMKIRHEPVHASTGPALDARTISA